MPVREAIIAELDANRESYVTFLQQLIQAASPNPPGDTTEAARVITNYLTEHGVESETIAPVLHAPNVVADFCGGRRGGQRVILNGHIDTYPVEKPVAWEKGPYSGYNDGSMVHGRGGVDMKAGTASSVIAYTILRSRAIHLKGSVGLMAVSDEETGGKWGTRYLLENCGNPSRWLGDVMLNAEPGGLQSIRFGEKGTLRMTFTVEAQGLNGAYTFLSRGANIIASRLINKLVELEDLEARLPEDIRKHFDSRARKIADEIMGEGASEVLLKPTVNIGTIRGGVKVNTIAEECVFEADIRLPIGMDASTILGRIDQYLQDFPQASYKVQEAASNPANFCTADHPFAGLIAKCAEEVTNIRPVMLAGLGGTDCKFYRYRGIPTYVYGPSPKGMGGSHEAVSIDEFLAVVKTHTLAVWDYLNHP
ncbi:putative acetylornithine deacetylase [Karstenula rhodostoma CBS 690.94]|uniref:Acetylornithine deacetylase n=1 Tax=Karstenula rhodostoma CBS 690.94 TaxID=1392251 RepID=A0A9P4PCI1_9PLEO|nr:putative acetylornithine deacetylase [Karstenula rhodostoma CBS 690.94]